MYKNSPNESRNRYRLNFVKYTRIHSPHSSQVFFRPAPTKRAQRTEKPWLEKIELSCICDKFSFYELKGFVQGMHACRTGLKRVCIIISALFLNRAFKNNIIIYIREEWIVFKEI